MQAETEILEEIVDLDKDRILSLVQKLDNGGIRRVFQLAISRLSSRASTEEELKGPVFAHWINTCPFLAISLSSSGTSQLLSLVKWAAQARWTYQKQLQLLLAFDPTPAPPWMAPLYKLARYWGATKSMVKLAVKQPEVFAEICIKDVEAPAQQSFSLSQVKTPLHQALKRLVKDDCEIIMCELAKRWETHDADAKLRKACHLTLTLHAEMQLLGFYERNAGLMPQLHFMGTSKKACYLCHEFLVRHPLRIRVSACHQKIYPSWMPPSNVGIPSGVEEKLFWNFSKHIEKVVVRELKTGLAAPRRPKTNDSTVGPTLTVTATVPTEVWVRHIAGKQLVFEGDGRFSQGD